MLTMQPKVLLRVASLSLWALFVGNAGAGEQKPLPTCLAGVCVGGKAPTESSVKKRFGGQSFALGHRTRGYCYELRSQDQAGYLLFALKNFGDGWRVVTIRVAGRPICAKPTPLKKPIKLATNEGVALDGPARSVRATYGEPSHTLDPQSRDLTIVLSSKGERIDTALQYVPPDASIALSAIFVISADRVVAIEVSADI